MEQALAGYRVLEYAHLVSGPYCAKLLADLGAEVIKIEAPGQGDPARRQGPFAGDVPDPEKSGLFLYLNSNKLGITLNLGTPSGKKVFLRLLEQADAFVENNPPSEMKRLGLTYRSLAKKNPGLVMTSITPFGQTGPYRDYKACDLVSYHMGGLGYITPGYQEDRSRPPLKAGGRQADFYAAINATVATLGALYYRDRAGFGQHVDISEQESVLSGIDGPIVSYTYEGKVESRVSAPSFAPRGIFPCKDGYICLVAPQEHEWQALVEMMGHPAWADEEWCRTRESRARNRGRLDALLSEWAMKHTKEEVFREGQRRQGRIAPVNTFQEVLNSDILASRDFFVEVEHPAVGRAKYPGAPAKLPATPWQTRRPAPLLGQHNEDIYQGRLGYTTEEVVRMRQAGTI